MAETETEHYLGHRERLKEKFQKGNPEQFSDYELLELLLFYSIPRKDVKPLAKKLLTHFKSLSGVFNADILELAKMPGVKMNTAILIKLSQAMMHRQLKEKIEDTPVINNWKALMDYFIMTMGPMREEGCRVLFLDSKCHLISDDLMFKGTINQTPILPREIAMRAANLGSAFLIVVHNHPSGDLVASSGDIQATKDLKKALEAISCELIDHIIVSKKGFYSLKNSGKL